jgi:hypothetical protein
MTSHARGRETAASAAQYLLLGGFAAVAAGISAQGLTGFARENMGLRGPWPYLLFLALDGAAGVCAVLLTRRAARAESGLTPRLAVWGLVGASASFNWTHAPHHPGAPEAFGLMPVIGAVLFEFTLRELRVRSADRADRQLTALRWAHPAERIRVQLRLAADDRISAEAATHRVRVDQAARRLYQLRLALHARDRGARPARMAARRARIAERRAHAALTRAGFADPDVAADVLRQVQVLIRTPDLARLDYTTAAAAQAAIASLITARPSASPRIPDEGDPVRSLSRGDVINGHSAASQRGFTVPGTTPEAAAPDAPHNAGLESGHQAGAGRDATLDPRLIAAAARILAEARQHGRRLSQKALGDRLRRDGHRVANYSLNRLAAAATGLLADGQADGGGPVLRPPATPALHPDEAGHATAAPSWPAPRRAVQVAAEPPGGQ